MYGILSIHLREWLFIRCVRYQTIPSIESFWRTKKSGAECPSSAQRLKRTVKKLVYRITKINMYLPRYFVVFKTYWFGSLWSLWKSPCFWPIQFTFPANRKQTPRLITEICSNAIFLKIERPCQCGRSNEVVERNVWCNT